MMEYLSEKIQKLLAYRIEQEEYSSRIYKAMAQYLNYNGYEGASKLWNKYSSEELVHAEKVNTFLLDLDYLPPVPVIKSPPVEFDGLVDIINKSLAHEQEITKQCEALAKAAMEESDFKTFGLAQFFVNEQVEELSKTQFWVDQLDTFGTNEVALKLLDEQMGDKA